MQFIISILFIFSATSAFCAEEKEIPPTYFNTPNTPGLTRIEDNSFLLEEAYNQERGVIQFIQVL